MSHDQHCSCGCNHQHAPDHQTQPITPPNEVTAAQGDFLHQLHHHHYLPVARFTLTDSREADFISTALAPVFIQAADDTMNMVKQAGAFLQTLEDFGLLTLDYDIPLDGYDYQLYHSSALYAYFCATVAEGAARPGFLGDTPVLELGSIALTPAGERLAADHCAHSHQHQE